MVIVIHGDDVAQSQQKLDEYLKGDWVVRIDAKKTPVDEIEKNFRTDSLFAEKRNIIVENLKQAPKSSVEKILELSKVKDSAEQVIIYSTEKIDKRFINKLGKPQIYEYQLPKLYFQFLDGIYPGNAMNSHKTLQELSKIYTAEQLFYSLVKRFRILLMLSTGNASSFDEINKMSDWQLVRLRTQANRWDREHLVKVYKRMYELEKGMKTSMLTTTLLNHIDIMLVSEL